MSSGTLRGGMLIFASMAIIGLIDNFIPVIAQHSGLWQFHALRSLIAVAILTFIIRARGRSVIPKKKLAVFIRSTIIAMSMLLYFGSLVLMPIAEAGAGLFTAPIFVLLFSALLFKTSIGIWRILAVALGFIGVLLVLKPDPSNFDLFLLFPVAAGFFYGLGQTITRHWCAHEDTLVVLLFFFIVIGLVGLVGITILAIIPVPSEWLEIAPFFVRGPETPTGSFVFWTLIQAVGSVVAVAGLIRGYQIAEPTFVGVFEYSFLLFAGIWGYVIWGDIPDALALAGICLIMAAGAVITIRSRGE